MTRRAAWVVVIASIALGVAGGGLALGAYSRWAVFDEVTHVVSTFAVTCAVALALGRRVPERLARRLVVFVAIGITIGLAWEIGESTIEWAASVDIRNRPHDTATDLVCDLLGAVAAAVTWPHIDRPRRGSTSDPLSSTPHPS